MIAEADLAALEAVIFRLETTDPIGREEALQRSAIHRRQALRAVVQEGASWSAATGDLPHFQYPDPVAYIKSIQNDFTAQLAIFSGNVDAWFDHCTHPAPGYTWRLTVMLRKSKLFDIERRFLTAYFKHFYTERGSSRDRDLGIRAIKIGIDIPAPPDSSPLPYP